jgi:N-acetylneuraminic acid mutarotase
VASRHPARVVDRVERVLSAPVLGVSASRRLPAPVQDPATTTVGGHALLIGGARRADVSTSALVLAAAHGGKRIGSLPYPVDDAAAATLAGRTYLIGGGQPAYSEILSVGGSAQPSVVGYLPVSASDVAAATLGSTVYVVGGYTGSRPLETIVAWTGSSTARVVARLPHPVFSAAVAAADGRLIIAGGTARRGATRDVYSFDPANGRVTRIASLAQPVTNAAAAPLDGRVYVIGGRSTAEGTQTTRISAVDPLTGRVWSAGRLPVALSNAGAAAVGQALIVAGGRKRSGALSDRTYVLQPRSGAA